jgi:outer membrane receptor protein involved in Fe transport
MSYHPSPYRLTFSFIIWLAPVWLSAQQETEATNPEVFELSPFVVEAEETGGYYASQTLAGTRLRTDLRDIAASVQILTKELMEDVGATNANELLLYTTGTEAYGSGGNFSGGSDVAPNRPTNAAEAMASPHRALRVRGLDRPDLTRNFFLTDIPFDSYNTSQVEVNRGANAILFGLGSPAGIVNNTLNQAQLERRFGETEFRLSQEGMSGPLSHRVSLDYNLPLIDKKLALRVAGLTDEYHYRQRPAHNITRRGYAVVQYRPFPQTVIRANYEAGRMRGNNPLPRGPSEDLSGYLYIRDQLRDAYADPLRNPNGYPMPPVVADSWAYANFLNSNVIPGDLANIYRGEVGPFDNKFGLQPVFAYGSGVGPGPDYGFTAFIQPGMVRDQDPAIPGLQHPEFPINGDGGNRARIQSVRALFVHNMINWTDGRRVQGLTDLQVFDFSRHKYGGALGFSHHDFSARNLSLEQTLWNGRAGFELVWDHQDYSTQSYEPFPGRLEGLSIDIMKTLSNGAPNPNFGRPMVVNRNQTNHEQAYTERDTRRATAFLNIDFRTVLKRDDWLSNVLGRHVITGVLTDSRAETRAVAGGERYLPVNPATDVSALPFLVNNPAPSSVAGIYYLGPAVDLESNPQALTMSSFRIDPSSWDGLAGYNPGGLLPNLTYWDPNRQTFVTEDFMRVATPRSGVMTRDQIRSQVAVLQSHLFWNRLVTTFGWRRDKPTSWRENAPQFNAIARVDPESFNLDTVQPLTQQEEVVSVGVVYHVPRSWHRILPTGTDLSLHYNESDNFTPSPGRRDQLGRSLPPVVGSTREHGITLSLFRGKLIARINRYESSINDISNSRATNLFNQAIWTRGLAPMSQMLNALHTVNPDDPGMANYGRLVPAINAIADFYGLILDIPGGTVTPDPQNPNSAIWPLIQGAPIVDAETGRLRGVNGTFISGLADTQNQVSKGTELEFVYKPLRNWDIFLNVAHTKVGLANNAPRLRAWAAQIEQQLLPVFGDLVFQNPAATPQPTSTTYLNSWNENVGFGVASEALSEGRTSPEVRGYRANLVTNYRFRSGVLRGFSAGGGLRWQDKAAIGYANMRLPDGTLGPNLDQPYFAPSETSIDLFVGYRRKLSWADWTLRFNVSNLYTSIGDVIPIRAQPDGSIAEVRFAPPRRYMITTKFSF